MRPEQIVDRINFKFNGSEDPELTKILDTGRDNMISSGRDTAQDRVRKEQADPNYQTQNQLKGARHAIESKLADQNHLRSAQTSPAGPQAKKKQSPGGTMHGTQMNPQFADSTQPEPHHLTESLLHSSIQTEDEKPKRSKRKHRRQGRDALPFRNEESIKIESSGQQFIDLRTIEKNRKLQRKLFKLNIKQSLKSSAEYQSAAVYLKDDFHPSRAYNN